MERLYEQIILYSSRDKEFKEILRKKIIEQGFKAIECFSFLDVVLYSDEKSVLFISDISYCPSYADVYLGIRRDKRYFVPNTLFILEGENDKVFTITKEEILDDNFSFDKYLELDAVFNFSKDDTTAFKNILSYYGLSYRYPGTKYLEEVITITYFQPFPYLKKIGLCYEYLSKKHNLSANAIEKKIKRAIVYARTMKGKGIMEMCEKYEIECPTIKLVISNILTKLYIQYF